jgi:YebC/PmpR family DNA-binding regulatory protein
MSGHNKWSSIKHKKGANDAKRGKLFTKLIKEITVAARMGGGDPDSNPRLRSAILSGKAANMPKDNIERAIKKGTGDLDGVVYFECTYEGYAPGGIAIFVEALTDNKNRIVGEVRHAFTKCNGNLGQDGSVAWMFERKGSLMIGGEDTSVDEDELMMIALEAGADDITGEEGYFFVTCPPGAFDTVRDALEDAGYPIREAGLARIPQNLVQADGKITTQVLRLLDLLEDNDDVQKVFHNAELDEAALEQAS